MKSFAEATDTDRVQSHAEARQNLRKTGPNGTTEYSSSDICGMQSRQLDAPLSSASDTALLAEPSPAEIFGGLFRCAFPDASFFAKPSDPAFLAEKSDPSVVAFFDARCFFFPSVLPRLDSVCGDQKMTCGRQKSMASEIICGSKQTEPKMNGK